MENSVNDEQLAQFTIGASNILKAALQEANTEIIEQSLSEIDAAKLTLQKRDKVPEWINFNHLYLIGDRPRF